MSHIIADESAIMPTTNPNEDTIRGLRELADFLEQHPEVPVTYVGAHVEVPYSHGARDVLVALAAALGDSAVEKIDSIGNVEIVGEFPGGVKVRGGCNPKYLGAVQPPAPVYDPIIPVRDGGHDA